MIEDPPKHLDEFIPSEEDKRVRINACATMWHENSEEIQVCLKSVFQMDKYINNRRRDDHERSEWQKWDWQTHIFFDDCMKKSRTEKVRRKQYLEDILHFWNNLKKCEAINLNSNLRNIICFYVV